MGEQHRFVNTCNGMESRRRQDILGLHSQMDRTLGLFPDGSAGSPGPYSDPAGTIGLDNSSLGLEYEYDAVLSMRTPYPQHIPCLYESTARSSDV
jgi:hypothetical protein